METRVTPNEVTAEFEALIDRARERGETLVVERDGRVICRITPEKKPFTGADFVKLLETMEWPDPDFGRDLEAAINVQEVAVPRSMWD
jgi:antitoxin (DNA-binding transcriptional repressor) of toxin-antitoxin stability system